MNPILIQALLIWTALGHSWVACSDYRGVITGSGPDYTDADCFGYARNWNGNNLGGNINVFASDRGFNYQPGGGRTCRDSKDDSVPYSRQYPMANYIEGNTYEIVWPAKNHARVRDFGLDIFACCGDSCTQAMEEDVDTFIANSIVVASFPAKRNGEAIGFGNCRDVSPSDDAVCSQRVQIPQLLSSGASQEVCTFLWYWPFNSDEDVYTTCFEATVYEPGSDIPTPPPLPPTQAPVEDPINGNCIRESALIAAYGQCGGVQQFGDDSLRCCISGHYCRFQNEFYSQCVPGSPPSQSPQPTTTQAPPTTTPRPPTTTPRPPTTTPRPPTTTQRPPTTTQRPPTTEAPGNGEDQCVEPETELQEWEQCGGVDAFGDSSLRCCGSGLVCSFQNDWYSQCLRDESEEVQPPSSPSCVQDGALVPLYGRCGGIDFFGDSDLRCCETGSVCVFKNEWYSQCLSDEAAAAQEAQEAQSATSTASTAVISGSIASGALLTAGIVFFWKRGRYVPPQNEASRV